MTSAQDAGASKKVRLLANLLYCSLVQIFQNKDGNCYAKDLQASFNHYWKLASNHLSIEKLYALIQPNRTSPDVIEPLLKIMFFMLQAQQAEENKSAEDMLICLRELIVKEQTNMNIVKLSAINLVKLKDVFPQLRQQSLDVLKELIEQLQQVIRTQFNSENSDNQIPQSGAQDLETIILSCRKFNQLMSSVSLVQLVNLEQVAEWNQFIMDKIFELIQKPAVLDKITKDQLVVLLQLPLECLKQLYASKQGFETDNIAA